MKIQRPPISSQAFEEAIRIIRERFAKAIEKHGPGAFISWHEIVGKLEEERVEFMVEVQHETRKRDAELTDIAVAAIWGLASHIDNALLDD
jgi:hypothetical protein